MKHFEFVIGNSLENWKAGIPESFSQQSCIQRTLFMAARLVISATCWTEKLFRNTHYSTKFPCQKCDVLIGKQLEKIHAEQI